MVGFISYTPSLCYASGIRAASASASASASFGFRIAVNSPPLLPPSLKKSSQLRHVYDPYRQVDLPSIDEVYNDDIPELMQNPAPLKVNRINIIIDNEIIKNLDLSPAHTVLRGYGHQKGDNAAQLSQNPIELLEQNVGFVINYERDDPYDVRELSEMSDVRLWFVRLDAAYPWLPVVLDLEAGELARYSAMLVPHQVSRRLGIVFNPDALELFVMKKLFIINTWLGLHKVPNAKARMNDMLEALGFKVDANFFQLLETH